MTGKELGKISKAWFGVDADDRYGLFLTFSGRGWGIDYFIEAREPKILEVLRESGRWDVARLTGTPVQVECRENTLVDWRVLTEVL